MQTEIKFTRKSDGEKRFATFSVEVRPGPNYFCWQDNGFRCFVLRIEKGQYKAFTAPKEANWDRPERFAKPHRTALGKRWHEAIRNLLEKIT